MVLRFLLSKTDSSAKCLFPDTGHLWTTKLHKTRRVFVMRYAVAQLVQALQAGRSRVRFPMGPLEISLT